MNTRRLKILNVLPRLDTGGAERVVIEIAEAVQKSGHQALIACAAGPLTQAALRTGAEILPLPLDTKSPFKMRANARKLEKLIVEQQIDLVHAHSRAPAWSAYWATRRTGTPFVTTYHGAYSEKSALKRRYNAVMAQGDRVVAVSGFIGELIRARYDVPEARLRVILGGVDPRKFDAAAVVPDRIGRLAKAWRVEMGVPVLLLPGRLTGWKGQRVMVEALARMRHQEAVAVFLGSDQGRENYTKNLLALAESLGVSARLRLGAHTEDMPAAMMCCDVVVNASTEPEAFGRTIVEGQAMGRMVIATDHGGARETILAGETGYLVPPGDAGALAAALDAALDMSQAQRAAWAARARAHVVQNYSVQAMQRRMLDVYAELLG